MSEQESISSPHLQNQAWRTEPEIGAERQIFLRLCRNTKPNLEKGIYPFKDIALTRADLVWLLATHENGVGPVDWSDEKQRVREGLDLRGANLQGVDLRGLPLSCMRGGLIPDEWQRFSPQLRDMAIVHLENAYLEEVHLEGAKLGRVNLSGENLFRAYLQRAVLHGAHLEGVNLYGAHLEGTDLRRVFFDTTTVLEGAALSNAYESFRVADVRWNSVNLAVVEWKQGNMRVGRRREKYLVLGDEARLHDSKKVEAGERLHYFNAAIRANNQVSITLRDQGLNDEAAYYAYRAQFLRRKALWWQALKGAVDSKNMPKLETSSNDVVSPGQQQKDAVSLGLWQRVQKFGAYIFSGFLALLSGYGYKPYRCIIAYISLVLAFALAHFIIGHGASMNEFINSVFLSIQAFHGRPFSSFSLIPSPSNPYIVLDSLEAIVGLLIEALVVAIFTQRILGR